MTTTSSITLPSVPDYLITTAAELATLVDHLREAGIFAFDTEFIGENTYTPILCLIQVATADRVGLIDPMAISREDMQPFWKLLANPAIEKICHAGDQDVEIAWQHSHLVPTNMFDTQIGAGMVGLAYPTALWRVVDHYMHITLDKAHTYSAWDRRPLSSAQFSYAIDDVRYLPAIHAMMKAEIEKKGHLSWMNDACTEMCEHAAEPVDARALYTKIRGSAGLPGNKLSVLREVTALREQLAFEEDVPSRGILRDELLFDIATRLPDNHNKLGALRDFPRQQMELYGDAIIAAVKRGLAVPSEEWPTIHIPGEDPAEVKRLGETLWVATQAICLGQAVTPAVVTSQNEILSLGRLLHRNKPLSKHELMTGWHRDCLGDKLVAFINGTLSVSIRFSDLHLHATFSEHETPPRAATP